MFVCSPLHPSETIPSPAHRSAAKSSDPYYIKHKGETANGGAVSKEPPTAKSSSEHKHKSHHHKKHKKEKSKKKSKEIDLLIEEPSQPPVSQNGNQGFEELITPMDDGSNARTIENYANNLLEDLDPVKGGNNNNGEPVEESEEGPSLISQDMFADLIASGDLKFKEKVEIPNDIPLIKVVCFIKSLCLSTFDYNCFKFNFRRSFQRLRGSVRCKP